MGPMGFLTKTTHVSFFEFLVVVMLFASSNFETRPSKKMWRILKVYIHQTLYEAQKPSNLMFLMNVTNKHSGRESQSKRPRSTIASKAGVRSKSF